MNSDFTAIILSGGKYSRMGVNKSFLEIDGQKIIDRIVTLCSIIFDKTIIITNSINEYEYLDLPCFTDIYKDLGPLSGIHSGLTNSNSENNFVISCDLPFINKDLINFIILQNSSDSIILPTTKERVHSVCGIYKKNCIPTSEKLLVRSISEMENQIKKSKSKIKLFDLINSVQTKFLEISNEPFYHKDLMFNMNTISDYEYAKREFLRIYEK